MQGEFIFLLLIFVAAILYSSVGHGGASGYLAIMAVFSVNPEYMRASALTLNLIVAGISFVSFYKGGYFKPKLLIPFIVLSIPMAYQGARIDIDPKLYKFILGVFLLIAVARMVYKPTISKESIKKMNIPLALFIGAFLGFFSGMIGIGGGIILSPVILLLRWATIKETAAISAIFIFLNSVSGLSGLYSSGIQYTDNIYFMAYLGITGGLFGAYLGWKKFSPKGLTYLLMIVLIFASFKLFIY